MAPLDDSDPIENALAIINELEAYNPELLDKPRWLVLNKIDMIADKEEQQARIDSIVTGLQWSGPVFTISAISNQGTQPLCYALMQLIDEMNEPKA